MTTEKTKLNISSIKSNPPFFLGSLTGDISDGDFDFEEPGSIEDDFEDMELKNKEVYDDGLELSINIDEESGLEPDKDLELHADATDMSSRGKEVELNFNSDTMSLEIGEETATIEGINQEESLEKNTHKKSVQKAKAVEVEEEIYLEPEDLKIDFDFDED